MPALKLDIPKLFGSTPHSHVTGFFKNDMNCAPDVAGLLARLRCVTVKSVLHLPTGSPLSQILAFYSYWAMFEALRT